MKNMTNGKSVACHKNQDASVDMCHNAKGNVIADLWNQCPTPQKTKRNIVMVAEASIKGINNIRVY